MKVSIKLVLLLMLVLAGCGSSEQTAADFVSSGDKLAAQGKVDKARVEYKNAIQIDPRQAKPYYKLALLAEAAKNWKEMFVNLRVVEQLEPNNADALVKLGRLYALGGQYDDATTRADKVLGLHPENIDAILLKTTLYTKKKNYPAATAELEKAVKLKPDDLEVLTMQVILARDQGNYQDALTKVDHALVKHPKKVSLLLIKLSIFGKQRSYAAMQPVYQQIIAQQPDDKALVVSYSQLLNNGLGKHDEAVKVLGGFVAKHPADVEAKQLLIGLEKSKNKDTALATLNSYLKADPKNYELRFTKVNILLEQKKDDLAQKELSTIIADDPDGTNGNKAIVIAASINAAEGHYDKAEKAVQGVLNNTPENTEALLLRAKLQLRKDGNTEQAITDLRTVLRNAPDSDNALVLLAQAYVKNGSGELAQDSLKQALKVNPGNTVAALSVAQSLMQQKNYTRTEKVLVKALKTKPNDHQLLQALAQVKILNKEWVGGSETINTLKAKYGDSGLTHYLSGQLAQYQGDLTTAVKEFKAALTANPRMSKALRELSFILEKQGQKEQLKQFLIKFTQQHPEQMDGHAILAIFYLKEQQADKAIALLNTQLKQHKNWSVGYNMLGDYYLNAGQTDKAIATYVQGQLNVPADNQIALKLASVYESKSDFNKAKAVYEKILARDSHITVAANNLASLLTDQLESAANLQKALKLATQFKDSANPYLLDSYGWVNVKLGNYKVAEPALIKVVSMADKVAIFNYHLGVLYHKSGNTEQARKYLQQAETLAKAQNNKQLSAQIHKALSAN